ncbi:homoserine kinase [Saccharopolyspora flava]|uniref:Homoserine kinase n=1 Tax=Saccharopolyspora flava TaxID=95161 RepID=A0A1I6PFF1_9PSEU|nr:homoserine kinase [Saccharopolyspora flava]SFS38937.1 homoserine kinase [Saccharopolyspora flava]
MSPLPVGAVRVEVPASTANLGSGFDALGMALSLHDTVFARVAEGPEGSATVSVTGQGAGSVPGDERHLVVRVIHDTLAELGFPAPPALELRCENSIPHSRGLGSSAAAIIAGIAVAHGLAGIDLRAAENAERALHLAAVREGHADNVAASLLGDFVLAWRESDRFRAVSAPAHPEVSPIAFVPQAESATHVTRGLLPERVPHADAAFAAGRAALAVHAITRDPSLLLAATDDRLHQDYREPAWPETVALVRALRAEGIAAAVSGAGPTVLALPVKNVNAREFAPEGFAALDLPVDRAGVRTHVEG